MRSFLLATLPAALLVGCASMAKNGARIGVGSGPAASLARAASLGGKALKH